MLEPLTVLETATYRQENHQAQLLKNEGQLAKAMDYFQQAVTQKSIRLLGEARSISATVTKLFYQNHFGKKF